MPLNTTMRDVVVLLISWGSALLISLGLRWWGDQHPAALQAPWAVVLATVLLPALLMAGWVLWSAAGPGDGEGGESTDSDQETH